MEKIKIKISSIIDETPWLFSGEGDLEEQSDNIILRATEYIQGEKILHRIDISQDSIQISRRAQNTTHLEFFKDRRGNITIQTPYGTFDGKTKTKVYAIKTTTSATYITLAYNTSFDEPTAIVKKVQISYSKI